MANNPLDELVQSSSNPVINQPVLAGEVNTSASPVSHSIAPNMPTHTVVPPASVNSVKNPLDELISGSVSTSQSPDVAPQTAAILPPELPSLNPAKIEKSASTAPTTSSSPLEKSLPIQSQAGNIPIDNPLDSLITHDSTEMIPDPNSAFNIMTDHQAKEKSAMSSLDAFVQPVASSPAPLAAAITENPISLDAVSKPKTWSSLPEHDIAPMSSPVSPLSPPPVATANIMTSPTIKPATVATVNTDQASTLSQKELEEKAKKLLKESPPKGKNSKKPWILGLLTLLIVVGAAGGGLLSYQMLNPTTNNETAAVAVGIGNCVMQVTSTGAPNESAGFGYKPASSAVSDATKYYDVSKGERVDFNVTIKNKTANPVSAVKRFYAVKVLESPRGTPVTASSPLDEATLITNHQQAPYDTQENPPGYKGADEPFTMQPNESKTFNGTWLPTDRDCGLYQIDMNVEDTAGVEASCEPDFVAAAGFVRVSGCQELCGKTCSSNATCQSINSAYACSHSNEVSAWLDKTQDVSSAGTGNLTCFNAFNNTLQAESFIKQHVVRDGKVWGRDNQGGSWKAWADETALINAGSGTITGFSAFVKKEGYIQQHLVQGGRLWARNNQGGNWTTWEDQTANVATEGTGEITGFDAYLKNNVYTVQFLVRGNEVYRRDEQNGWSDWEKVTSQLTGVGTGNITCYDGHMNGGQVNSGVELHRIIRAGKLLEFTGDWFEGECRLATNPSSQTCAPAPTPEALACTGLTKAPVAPKLGEVVTLTCAAAPLPVAKYEFRYTLANGNYTALTPETANPNTTKLTVTSSGAYKVECRACEDAAGTSCTTWGIAK